MRNLFWCVMVLGVVLHSRVAAQPELDTSFNSTGIQTVSFAGLVAGASDVAVQADNKVVMVGGCRLPPFSVKYCIARYNENGSLDTSFGGGQGFVQLNDITYSYGVAIQNNGKIVAVGSFNQQNQSSLTVVRHNPDGSLDSSFGSGGKIITQLGLSGVDIGREVVIQPDGKIVVVGTSSPLGFVIRYLPNGTPDSSFAAGGMFTINIATGDCLTLQPDGKILVGGYMVSTTGSSLIRLNPDGSLDTTWDGDGILTVTVPFAGNFKSIAVMPDGRVVAVIEARVIYRFNSNGSLDTSFDGDGYRVFVGEQMVAVDIMVSGAGKITVVGQDPTDTFVILRFNADGNFDNGFSGDGRLRIGPAEHGFSMGGGTGGAIDGLGRLVVGGYAGDRFAVLRLVGPPVAATISGRVTNSNGSPILGAVVKTDVGGTIITARTNPFGYYNLAGVLTGQTYTLSASAKGHRISSQSVFVNNQFVTVDFIAQ